MTLESIKKRGSEIYERVEVRNALKIGGAIVAVMDFLKAIAELPDTLKQDSAVMAAIGHILWRLIKFPLQVLMLWMFFFSTLGPLIAGLLKQLFSSCTWVTRGKFDWRRIHKLDLKFFGTMIPLTLAAATFCVAYFGFDGFFDAVGEWSLSLLNRLFH